MHDLVRVKGRYIRDKSRLLAGGFLLTIFLWIKAAAKKFDVEVSEKSWREIGK